MADTNKMLPLLERQPNVLPSLSFPERINNFLRMITEQLPTDAEESAFRNRNSLSKRDPQLVENYLRKMFNLSMFGSPIVWHGSPHRFAPTTKNPLGEFDVRQIGTGEGAQAYGHGFYLAENPEVGRIYTKQSSQTKPSVTLSTGETFTYDTPQAKALLGMPFRTVNEAQIRYLEIRKEFPDGGYDQLFEAIKDLPPNAKINQGNLYKVDLPDEMVSKMLDWDKPLSQQKDILDKLGMSEEWLKYIKNWGGGGDSVRSLLDVGAAKFAKGSGIDTSSREAFSKYLASKGIPGIKYLDQGSRTQGKGTYNYVVFPGEEKAVQILERK